MLTVYVCGGPNPRKVAILLEELGWEYRSKLVDIYLGEQRSEDYLAINPNGRLPALVDENSESPPVVLWESGVILEYLADKSGRFLPKSGAQRYEVLKWLHFQLTHAPYLGNAHLYRVMYKEAIPFDIKRFTIESARIYGVLDAQLGRSQFVAGDDYSIADMAWYPWIQYHEWQGQDLADFPNVSSWFGELSERPAVRKGAAIPWAYGEYGPSAVGEKVSRLVDRRLKDPQFTLSATAADDAMCNLAPK
ncbi:glutathione S-transferase N-terminal domain-containing protein [Paraburkholderia sp. BL10I2N1]|uniref:glutathione S-transferase family protein n=1 Tax=Paraburkholderia sp. BL10I2N1 TaxID=1938796 RepID=UPI00105C99A6|nr:glutathione S-transferase N-terminal domain-containing protein [Paraburkholderia sp. BL10I2N1]TDN69992.1 GST-like protein [Paraburkholderia sp. BL10I2N1]